MVYFHGRPTFLQIPKRILASLHASLKFIYFHGQPARSEIKKNYLIFIGDLPFFKFQKEFQEASMLL